MSPELNDVHASCRSSPRLWWRTCVCAQSRPALKTSEGSALKWCPLQSEFCICAWFLVAVLHKCVSCGGADETCMYRQVLQTSIWWGDGFVFLLAWSLCVCKDAACCKRTQKGSSKDGSAPSRTASPQLSKSAGRTRRAR